MGVVAEGIGSAGRVVVQAQHLKDVSYTPHLAHHGSFLTLYYF